MTQSRRTRGRPRDTDVAKEVSTFRRHRDLSLIHISEPTRRTQ